MEINRRIPGDEHPNTLIFISNLTDTYSGLGQRNEAAALKEKVLSKGMLDKEYPDTLISISNLAVSYSGLGRRYRALALKEQVVEMQ